MKCKFVNFVLSFFLLSYVLVEKDGHRNDARINSTMLLV